MKSKFLAQAINFQEIIKNAFPGYSPGKIDITKTNLTIGDIFTAILPSIYVLAGLILFIYLIIGGFSLLTSAGDPKKVESAQGKITSAIVGFLIIFVSYWIIQILEIVFGIEILGLP